MDTTHEKTSPRRSLYARSIPAYLLRALIGAPLAGAVCGYAAGLCGVLAYINPTGALSLILGMFVLGLPWLLLFGFPTPARLQKADIDPGAAYLTAGALLLGGVFICTFPDAGILGIPFIAALVFGMPTGLLLGLLTFWPLRTTTLPDMAKYLIGGTLLFALPVAIIPNAVVFSWFSGALGYGLGYFLLRRKIQRQTA